MQCRAIVGLTSGIMAVALHASPLYGEDLEGIVRSAGTAMNAYVFLAKSGEAKGPKVCDGELAQRVKRLSGMTVRVSGTWHNDPQGAPQCFAADQFLPLKSSSGRDLVVGQLAGTEGSWTLTGEDGKITNLSKIPESLKKLTGKKVIVALNVVTGGKAKEGTVAVVTSMEYP